MNYRNARMANGFLSLDQLAGKVDLVKSRTVSDRGAGVERIVRMIDCSEISTGRRSLCEAKSLEWCSIDGKPRWLVEEQEAAMERARRIDAARQKLRRAGLGYLIETFLLICKNGKHRDESIQELAARRGLSYHAAEVRYFGHREKILNTLGIQ